MSTATDMRDVYLQAEQDILQHGQSSALSGSVGRMLTMADLESVRKGRMEWERRAAAEEQVVALGRSGGVRIATFRD
jgi:hypothetical protein